MTLPYFPQFKIKVLFFLITYFYDQLNAFFNHLLITTPLFWLTTLIWYYPLIIPRTIPFGWYELERQLWQPELSNCQNHCSMFDVYKPIYYFSINISLLLSFIPSRSISSPQFIWYSYKTIKKDLKLSNYIYIIQIIVQ